MRPVEQLPKPYFGLFAIFVVTSGPCGVYSCGAGEGLRGRDGEARPVITTLGALLKTRLRPPGVPPPFVGLPPVQPLGVEGLAGVLPPPVVEAPRGFVGEAG